MAAAVTVTDAVVAVPFAYFMARIAAPRTRTALFVAILLPLWASYLAKVHSWLLIFTTNGFLGWALELVGIGKSNLIYTNGAVFIVFCYLWLPYMIIPVYSAFEREVIVTVSTAGAQNTLPLWIFGAIRLGQRLPEVNAVVTIVIALTLIPVIMAARIAGSGAVTRSARGS